MNQLQKGEQRGCRSLAEAGARYGNGDQDRAPTAKPLPPSDIKWVINPYDEYAVEAALRLKDSQGANVTILSLGPQRAVESIRSALAMGADQGRPGG